MRSVQVTAFGDPEVLRVVEAPRPIPESGEVVVGVEVAEILFLDTQLRAGWGRDYFAIEPPFIPGVGIAGTVFDLGAGVDERWRGAHVVTSTSGTGTYRGGGYAEFAIASVEHLHHVPDEVDATTALAALHDGAMAVSRIAKSGLSTGDAALVTAASGGIGVWLVPLLSAAGIHVTAAARGEQKVELALDRGAKVSVDYGNEGWNDGLSEVDVVFDGAGGDLGRLALERLRRGGRLFAYGASAGDFIDEDDLAAERNVEVIGLHEKFTEEDAHRAAEVALQHLADQVMYPVIGQQLPLEKAAEAHAAIEGRLVRGKSVLVL